MIEDEITKFSQLSSMVEEEVKRGAEFFSTIDSYLDSIDNTVIANEILKKYPLTSPYNENLNQLKEQILIFLDDKAFIKQLLEKYNINVYNMFQILYRMHASIFKGPFIKKIKLKLRYKPYAKLKRRQS